MKKTSKLFAILISVCLLFSVTYVPIAADTLQTPTADYGFHIVKKALSFTMNYEHTSSKSTWDSQKNIGEIIDLSSSDYLEFDICTTGTADDDGVVALYVTDNGGKFFNTSLSISGDWQHIVIEKNGWHLNSGATITSAKIFRLDAMTAGTTYHIANVALTNFAPEANYGNNSVKKELPVTNKNVTRATDYIQIFSNFSSNPVDLTNYDYLEFDICTEGVADSDGNVSLYYNSAYYNKTRVNVSDRWQHVKLDVGDVSNWEKYGGTSPDDISNITLFGLYGTTLTKGTTYHIANVALTIYVPEADYGIHTVARELPITQNELTNKSDFIQSFSSFSDNPVDLTNYDYLEFDIRTTGVADSDGKVQFTYSDGRYYNTDVEVKDTWQHVVLDVGASNWRSWGAAIDITNITQFGFFGSSFTTGTTYHIANVALTNFLPKANYGIHTVAKSLPNHLAVSSSSNDISLGETVDFSQCDYLEFDICIEGAVPAGTTAQLLGKSAGSYIYKNVPISTDWQHVVIENNKSGEWVAWGNATKSAVTAIGISSPNAGTTYHIANLALTNFAPEMNNTHYLADEFPGTIKKTGSASIWDLQISFGKKVNLKAYDYLEFDVYYEGEAENKSIQLQFNGGGTGYSDYGFYFAKNWTHVIIPSDKWYSWGGDATQATALMLGNTSVGNTYYVSNIAFTNHSYDYANASYVWNGAVCTATATCTGCTKTVTETVTGDYETVTSATCTAPETGHYKATFTNTNFEVQYSQTFDNTTVPATGHTNAEPAIENLVAPAFNSDTKTYTDGSYDEVVYCSVCHEEISRTPKVLSIDDYADTKDLSSLLKVYTQTNPDTNSIRIITLLDNDIDVYGQVGFRISIDSSDTYERSVNTVYTSLINGGNTLLASEVNENAKYFVILTMYFGDEKPTNITARPYVEFWADKDGKFDVTLGEEKSINPSQLLG